MRNGNRSTRDGTRHLGLDVPQRIRFRAGRNLNQSDTGRGTLTWQQLVEERLEPAPARA